MRKIDRTGHVYGRVTVLSEAPRRGGKIAWNCRCACGREFVATGGNLSTGNTKQCLACRLGSQHAHLKKFTATHGMSRTSLYKCWQSIKDRIFSPSCRSYPDYGGRGLDMDPRWAKSFEAFMEDVGERPAPGLSLDRIDNDKGYWPSNVRWATREQQMHNIRKNVRCPHCGKVVTRTEWVRW